MGGRLVTTGDRELVRKALRGDIESFEELTREPREELFTAHPPVTYSLHASAVASVLRQLGAGRIRPEQAQAWASFVRRGEYGYFTYRQRVKRGIRSLDIEYGTCEEVIVEAVSRLDELGDLIDGEISNSEIAELLAALELCDGQTPDSPPRPLSPR